MAPPKIIGAPAPKDDDQSESSNQLSFSKPEVKSDPEPVSQPEADTEPVEASKPQQIETKAEVFTPPAPVRAETVLPQADPVAAAIMLALKDPQSLSLEQIELLKSSPQLESLKNNLDRLSPKKLTADELNEFRMSESMLIDLYKRIGELEVQKSVFIEQVHVIENQKSDFISMLGKKHNMPPSSKWTIDLDTGDIIQRE